MHADRSKACYRDSYATLSSAGGAPMRRPAHYSRSPRGPQDAAEPGAPDQGTAAPQADGAVRKPRWRPGRWSTALMLVGAIGLGAGGALLWPPQQRQLTQKDIDAAVLHTLQTTT